MITKREKTESLLSKNERLIQSGVKKVVLEKQKIGVHQSLGGRTHDVYGGQPRVSRQSQDNH
jgi:hypothetical protein